MVLPCEAFCISFHQGVQLHSCRREEFQSNNSPLKIVRPLVMVSVGLLVKYKMVIRRVIYVTT